MAYRQLVSARRRWVSSSGTYVYRSSSTAISLARQHLSENFSNSTGNRDNDTRLEDLLEDGLAASGNRGSSISTLRGRRHDLPVSSGSGSLWESLQHYSNHHSFVNHGYKVARGLYSLSSMHHRGLSSSSTYKECTVQEMSPSTNGGLRVLVKESSCMDERILSHLLNRRLFSSTSTSSHASPYREVDTIAEQSKKPKALEPSAEDCDQAVEGLSSVKAKARKVQEVHSKGAGVLKKIWAGLLGIGPAFRAVAAMSREDWAKKLSHWKAEFWDTMKHYWVGTKLLWADIRISLRLLLKLAGGTSLTRRERQQLTRTTADIFRLVPFAVFIIVPFMEFLLPVFLKLFPNMLPSTFQDKMKEQEALKRKLNARIEYAKFLQDTVKEMAKEIKTTRSGEVQRTAEDLDQFMNNARRGENVSNDEILAFAKLFNDELTLDNISRPRLVSMCKYMGIKAYGTDAYLRHMLRSKLAWIKNDDRMIQAEGVESLSEAELRAACRDRGMLGLLSVEEMRQQLKDWLDLSLNHSVPSSLLILSRAFTVSGKVRPEEAVQATLSSLPDEVVESVGFTALPSEDVLAERMRKLEFLQKEEKLIKEETKKEELEQEKLKVEVAAGNTDHALQDMKEATTRELANQKHSVKQEDLCKLSNALAVLASASSVSKERAEFLRLVNKEIGLYNEMVEKEGTEGEAEARRAYQEAHEDRERSSPEAKVSTALVEKIDAMLQNLEKELDDVDAVIGNRWKLLDRDSDGKVTPEEVAAAAMFLKDSLGQEPVQELISNLAKDKDGKILVEDIVKLGTVIDQEESDEVGAKQRQ